MKNNKDLKKYIETIKKSYLFKGMNETEIESTLPCLMPSVKKYEKNESILKIGDKTNNIGLILNGMAHIIQEDYWGRTMLFSEISTSGVFAEVFAMLNRPLEVNVVANTECEILFLNISNLITTCSSNCNHHNKLIQNILISIAEKNIIITQKINHIGKKSIREKLLSYLSSQSIKNGSPKFKIPFNRQDLANYLCVDRSALSTEIGKLQKEGIIKSERNEFEITKNI